MPPPRKRLSYIPSPPTPNDSAKSKSPPFPHTRRTPFKKVAPKPGVDEGGTPGSARGETESVGKADGHEGSLTATPSLSLGSTPVAEEALATPKMVRKRVHEEQSSTDKEKEEGQKGGEGSTTRKRVKTGSNPKETPKNIEGVGGGASTTVAASTNQGRTVRSRLTQTPTPIPPTTMDTEALLKNAAERLEGVLDGDIDMATTLSAPAVAVSDGVEVQLTPARPPASSRPGTSLGRKVRKVTQASETPNPTIKHIKETKKSPPTPTPSVQKLGMEAGPLMDNAAERLTGYHGDVEKRTAIGTPVIAINKSVEAQPAPVLVAPSPRPGTSLGRKGKKPARISNPISDTSKKEASDEKRAPPKASSRPIQTPVSKLVMKTVNVVEMAAGDVEMTESETPTIQLDKITGPETSEPAPPDSSRVNKAVPRKIKKLTQTQVPPIPIAMTSNSFLTQNPGSKEIKKVPPTPRPSQTPVHKLEIDTGVLLENAAEKLAAGGGGDGGGVGGVVEEREPATPDSVDASPADRPLATTTISGRLNPPVGVPASCTPAPAAAPKDRLLTKEGTPIPISVQHTITPDCSKSSTAKLVENKKNNTSRVVDPAIPTAEPTPVKAKTKLMAKKNQTTTKGRESANPAASDKSTEMAIPETPAANKDGQDPESSSTAEPVATPSSRVMGTSEYGASTPASTLSSVPSQTANNLDGAAMDEANKEVSKPKEVSKAVPTEIDYDLVTVHTRYRDIAITVDVENRLETTGSDGSVLIVMCLPEAKVGQMVQFYNNPTLPPSTVLLTKNRDFTGDWTVCCGPGTSLSMSAIESANTSRRARLAPETLPPRVIDGVVGNWKIGTILPGCGWKYFFTWTVPKKEVLVVGKGGRKSVGGGGEGGGGGAGIGSRGGVEKRGGTPGRGRGARPRTVH